MSRYRSDLFAHLKRNRTYNSNDKSDEEPYFQIRFDDGYPLLLIVNANGERYQPSDRFFGGYTRKILRAIASIEAKDQNTIQWGDKKKDINLSENEFLMWYLSQSDRVVGEDFHPLTFIDQKGRLKLHITGDTQLQCMLWLEVDNKKINNFGFISDSYIFFDHCIVNIAPVGENYKLLDAFDTIILTSELTGYLSLLFSYFENIVPVYRDFKVVSGPPQQATASIIFEKVDPSNSLHLRVSQTIFGYDTDFIENYNLSRIIHIREFEREITVCDIDYQNQKRSIRKMNRLLNRLKQNLEATDSDYFFDDNRYIIDELLAIELVMNSLPQIASEYSIFGAERLKRYKIKSVEPGLHLSVTHGIDFLEGTAELDVAGERFPLFEALYQLRNNAYIQLSDDTRAIIDPDYIRKLERIFLKRKDKVAISIYDLPIIEDLQNSQIAGNTYQGLKDFFHGFSQLKQYVSNLPDLKEELREYQKTGFRWLKYLCIYSQGGCLADDMGLGKTIQTIALLSSLYPNETTPSLIIVPKSLIFNWEQEILKFNPDLSFYRYYGPQRDLGTALGFQVIITSYGTVRNEIEQLSQETFCYVILDESQQIKNLNSQISKAVILLKSKYRLALSGTPIENNLAELYALFRFLNPAILGGLERFTRCYLNPIQQHGEREIAGELKKKIQPFLIRRLKKEVLKDLPEKIEQTLFVELASDHRRFYEQRRSFFYDTVSDQIAQEGIKRSQFFVLQAITELRQIASIPESKSEGQIVSPKREVLLESIQDSVANHHKILLFANFLSVLDHVSADLERIGVDFEMMTGATRNRDLAIKRFQTDPQVSIFLMTLKTGGQGLNLTAADTVFIFDPWWNVAAENQAIDRAHRIGQDRTVFSYKLITKGTIEEKILLLQEKKKRLLEEFISTEKPITSVLNEQDIDFLFGEA